MQGSGLIPRRLAEEDEVLSAHDQLLPGLIGFATVASSTSPTRSAARQTKGDVSPHNMWVSQGNLCHMVLYELNTHTEA